MTNDQLKQFIDWINKVLISSNIDVTDNYHTSGRKYYEGYNDAILDVKCKLNYIVKELE